MLDILATRAALCRQHDLLQRLQRVFRDDPRCLAAVAVGSLAEGRADALSEVDLIVYCEAGAAPVILAALSAVAADRPVVHRLAGPHDEHSVHEKVILDDGRPTRST